MSRLFMLMLIIAGAFFPIACAKAPVAEMQDAENAVAEADANEDIHRYAPDTLKRAKDSLEQMHKDAETKDYDAVLLRADESIQLAGQAGKESIAAKEQAADETEALLKTLPQSEEAAEQALDAAWLLQDPALDVDSMILEMEAHKQQARDARSAFDRGEYQEASEKAMSARSAYAEIVADVSTLLRKRNPKK